jgi:F-type H+/Na+-transporting ATPase subunit alpha
VIEDLVDEVTGAMERALAQHRAPLSVREIGRVTSIAKGVARVKGLPGVRAEELVHFATGVPGLVFNLDPDEVGVVLLGRDASLQAGAEVRRSGRVLDVPVGPHLLGRVVDGNGNALDEAGSIPAAQRLPVERAAPTILARSPVSVPLHTGVKIIDALVPIGRGQRQLILGDRQTGKTSLAVDTIINQRDKNVVCVYCAIGQRGSAVARVIESLRTHDALAYSVIVVAGGEESPGAKFIAPYAATSMAEYFRDQGRDVLIVYDDLTRHAQAYRELSLLLRRPPGREAFPGDIFYVHSRLLERSTQLRAEHGGGSLSALPIIETEAQNLSAFIPTNLISITDGQIYLSPNLYRKGLLPAIDVGRSVSRVGGHAQLPAYRIVVGDLRLAYSQFEELEIFSRFGTRLDDATRQAIERGRRVREVLKQGERQALGSCEQIAILLALNNGLFDELDTEEIAGVEHEVRAAVVSGMQRQCRRIDNGEQLTADDRDHMLAIMRQVLASRAAEHRG